MYETFTPWPGTASNESPSGTSMPLIFAAFKIASPSGCSEPFSDIAAYLMTSLSVDSILIMSVTEGSPLVRVPVLSKTMVVSFCARSRYSPPLIKIPASAPLPTPTMRAAGVAIPRAHGHEIISTAMKASSPCGKFPAIHQPKNAINAAATTAGTK